MGDMWLWFVFAGVPFDVRGGSSFFFFFFFRAVLSLGRPPSQHTWFSHPSVVQHMQQIASSAAASPGHAQDYIMQACTTTRLWTACG